MASNDTGRPSKNAGPNDENSTDRGGATRGPAGAIIRTVDAAPDWAGPDLIRAVAIRVHRDGADPEDLWSEVRDQ